MAAPGGGRTPNVTALWAQVRALQGKLNVRFDPILPGSMESSRHAVKQAFADMALEQFLDRLESRHWRRIPTPRWMRTKVA